MGRPAVQGENQQRWQELCEQASVEQDPEKLLKLIQEITKLLSEKRERLTAAKKKDTAG